MASDGSSSVLDRSSRPPLEAYGDPVGVARHLPVGGQQRLPGVVGEPVPARPRQHRQGRTGSWDRGEIGVRQRLARISDRELHAGRQRLRSQSGQHVGRSAAEGRRRLEATPDGQVAAEALPRGLDRQRVPGAQRQRGVRAHPSAVHQHVGRRSGDRDPVQRRAVTTRPPSRHSMAAASSGLPTSRLASRSAARSAAPDGETPRCAWPSAAQVLQQRLRVRSGRRPARQPPSATKRTTVPGCSSAGGVRSRSHSDRVVCPISCQPPGPLRG